MDFKVSGEYWGIRVYFVAWYPSPSSNQETWPQGIGNTGSYVGLMAFLLEMQLIALGVVHATPLILVTANALK